jgi:hypothetical protein
MERSEGGSSREPKDEEKSRECSHGPMDLKTTRGMPPVVYLKASSSRSNQEVNAEETYALRWLTLATGDSNSLEVEDDVVVRKGVRNGGDGYEGRIDSSEIWHE